MPKRESAPEFEKSNTVMAKILSVPRRELQKREKQHRRNRARLKKKK